MSKLISDIQNKYLDKLRKKDSLLTELEVFAKANSVPIIDWQAAELLEQLISIHKPKQVLELGTAIGYSGIRIARRLSEDAELHTIELSRQSIKIARKNFKRAGVESKIKIFFGNAVNLLPKFSTKYDFIFLDADKKDYLTLFNMALNLLKENGVMVIDNLLWQGYAAADNLFIPKRFKNSTEKIREFNKIFMNTKLLQAAILPIGDGLGIGIKI